MVKVDGLPSQVLPIKNIPSLRCALDGKPSNLTMYKPTIACILVKVALLFYTHVQEPIGESS